MAVRYFSCSGGVLYPVDCSTSNEMFILHVVPIYVKMYQDDAINILHL